MDPFARDFLALGPPTILAAGTTLTILLAVMFTGARMWWVLAVGPLLTLAVAIAATWFVIAVLQPGEGSGFLLGAAALGLYSMGITPYYLILIGVGVWVGTRGPGERSEGSDP